MDAGTITTPALKAAEGSLGLSDWDKYAPDVPRSRGKDPSSSLRLVLRQIVLPHQRLLDPLPPFGHDSTNQALVHLYSQTLPSTAQSTTPHAHPINCDTHNFFMLPRSHK